MVQASFYDREMKKSCMLYSMAAFGSDWVSTIHTTVTGGGNTVSSANVDASPIRARQ
jgi:hypothetical protein